MLHFHSDLQTGQVQTRPERRVGNENFPFVKHPEPLARPVEVRIHHRDQPRSSQSANHNANWERAKHSS